jgi:hypothetical protein
MQKRKLGRAGRALSVVCYWEFKGGWKMKTRKLGKNIPLKVSAIRLGCMGMLQYKKEDG